MHLTILLHSSNMPCHMYWNSAYGKFCQCCRMHKAQRSIPGAWSLDRKRRVVYSIVSQFINFKRRAQLEAQE